MQISPISMSVYFAEFVGAAFSLLGLHIVYVFAYYWHVNRCLLGPCLKPFFPSTVVPSTIVGTMSVWLLPTTSVAMALQSLQ
jgi:hypothetical protein